MGRVPTAITAGFAAAFMFAGHASADGPCRIQSSWRDASEPTYLVSFIFVGVQDEQVMLSVDEAPIFEARLTTEDQSTSFSGETQCLMVGRYWINVKIGEAEGNLHFDVSERTTIYLNAYRGVLTFNIWGPDAPGLD